MWDITSLRGVRGVGLRLYIVRRLLELLGGAISIDSELGRGSTFRVWLPADARVHRATQADACAYSSGRISPS